MCFMYTQNKVKLFMVCQTHRQPLRKHVFHFSIKPRKGSASHSGTVRCPVNLWIANWVTYILLKERNSTQARIQTFLSCSLVTLGERYGEIEISSI
jgi:hypothetical protein